MVKQEMSFAKRLNQAMTERQISQTELAAAIGKGKSSVSQYISGKNVPKLEVQKQIADFLDCTVEWLNSDVPVNDHTEKGLKNVSVEQAAKMLGKSEQFIRVALQTGTAPFGFAAKNKTIWSYHISPKKLNEYIGQAVV
jgi:transcriptional regulator with XRE-family HTH domain